MKHSYVGVVFEKTTFDIDDQKRLLNWLHYNQNRAVKDSKFDMVCKSVSMLEWVSDWISVYWDKPLE